MTSPSAPWDGDLDQGVEDVVAVDGASAGGTCGAEDLRAPLLPHAPDASLLGKRPRVVEKHGVRWMRQEIRRSGDAIRDSVHDGVAAAAFGFGEVASLSQAKTGVLL